MKFAAFALLASSVSAKTSIYMSADETYDLYHNGVSVAKDVLHWNQADEFSWESETDVIAIHAWELNFPSPRGIIAEVTDSQGLRPSNPADWRCMYVNSDPTTYPENWTMNDFDDSEWQVPVVIPSSRWGRKKIARD
jgi:hypothetical protein